jgi:N-acylglucosamine 2-epimerase
MTTADIHTESFDPNHPATWYRQQLLDNVLPFWLQHAWDTEHGGLFTSLDRDGTVYDTDKSIWFQGRAGWLLGTLCHQLEPRPEWLTACRSCVNFLQQHGFDRDGRMFFSVTREGRPLRKRRYVFSEMFAAMAFAAYAAVVKDETIGRQAIQLFEQACERLTTPGGVEPKTVVSTRPTRSFSGPMIILGTAQALRAALHSSPWFAAAVQKRLESWIDRSIEEIQTYFMRPELEAVLETVLADGQTFLQQAEGRLINPGHVLEGAWFVMLEGVHRGQPERIQIGLDMLRWTWCQGWDPQYGGILYFRDVLGKPSPEYWHDMKFWWPQCEAIIATLMAWRITGESEYREWYLQCHGWAFQHFADPLHGEWFGWLRRDGEPTHHAKGSLWKGPFHLPRMLMFGAGLGYDGIFASSTSIL